MKSSQIHSSIHPGASNHRDASPSRLGWFRSGRVSALFAGVLLSASFMGCATARLEPSDPGQKVANKPKAAAVELGSGLKMQVEADTWVADDRVKNEVTAMKVTIVNRGQEAVSVNYNAFRLVSDTGSTYMPVAPEDISIRGATRSIGLPADTIITRSSDSTVNAPDREENDKTAIRKRLKSQALRSGELPAGERSVGYVFFERVPTTVQEISFRGTVQDVKTGKSFQEAQLSFRPRENR